MCFEEFREKVMGMVQEILGDGYEIGAQDYDGLNGTVRRSISVAREGTNASMRIDMDGHYKEYKLKGKGMGAVAGQIAKCCRENAPNEDIRIPGFGQWGSIKGHVFAKLVNTKKNKKLLEGTPHKEYLDLSVIYYARIPGGEFGRDSTATIWNTHMEYWGVGVEEIHRAACENMQEDGEAVFESLAGLIFQYMDAEGIGEMGLENKLETEAPQMFVLSNRHKANGAAQILNQDIMGRVSKHFKSDLWILPSSTHEVIVIPTNTLDGKAGELAAIVREINSTQVKAEEFPSDHVYFYSRMTGEVSIGA